MKKKNYNIELMRFIFTVVIICLHFGMAYLSNFNRTTPTFFRNGRIGVEFFFIVSGYLMMNSLSKADGRLPIHKNTQSFMVKKVLGIFPYHVVAFGFTAVAYFACKRMSFAHAVVTFIKLIPNFFLTINLGLPEVKIIGSEWYISSMLIAMFVLTPFVLKFKKNFSRLFCPVFSLFAVGFLVKYTGLLGSPEDFLFGDIVSKGLVRAFAEICLGAFVYELSNKLASLELGKKEKLFVTITEFLCYGVSLAYSVLKLDVKYDSYIVFVLALAVTITFSGQSYFDGKVNPKVASFLGRISLPLYISQRLPLYFVNAYFTDERIRFKFIFAIAVDILMIIPVLLLGDRLKKRMVGLCKKYKLMA